jgi:hypothetical protein
MKRHL